MEAKAEINRNHRFFERPRDGKGDIQVLLRIHVHVLVNILLKEQLNIDCKMQFRLNPAYHRRYGGRVVREFACKSPVARSLV